MGNYTFNKLKEELKEMTRAEKEERLRDIQATLMSEKGKEKGNAFFGTMGQKRNIPHHTRTLRKQIAIIKTDLR